MYTEEEVLFSLRRKQDILVKGKHIIEKTKNAKGDVGIKTRGKIDFLVKYLGYIHYFTSEFPK